MENAQNAFPTSSLDGAQNAPPTTVHKASSFVFLKKKEKRLQWRPSLRRLTDNPDALASLRSDHDAAELVITALERVITMPWTK